MHIPTRRPFAILFILIGCGSRDATPVVQQPDNEPRAEPSFADASAPAPTVSGEKLPAELQAMLDEHNRLRAQHCAEPLAWSDTVAHAAKAWVDHLAARGCGLEHSEGSYGENIAGGSANMQGDFQRNVLPTSCASR